MQSTADTTFLKTLWAYYDAHGRHELPWRLAETDGGFDPYKILVSELMLQQTQVGRVIPKFLAFIKQFPTVQVLAAASIGDVLIVWSGLGYNRRAKFLWQAAQKIISDGGVFPQTFEGLVALPGVGPNTAGAIMAYAFNQPQIFIETNIRTVYIHHYFSDRTDITDKELLPLIARTIPPDQARLFYWAIMDYGTHIKQTVGNLNKLSKTYSKQSTFVGSLRQVRGQVIRLLSQGARSITTLRDEINDDRLEAVLQALVREGLIVASAENYRLA